MDSCVSSSRKAHKNGMHTTSGQWCSCTTLVDSKLCQVDVDNALDILRVGMVIRDIEPLDTLKVRQAILRPNGCLEDCVFPGDSDLSTKHFGAFSNNCLIGIVSLYKRDNSDFHGNGYQVRAMAALPQTRGKGVGAKLLKRAEECAFENDADYIWANARVSAKEFYRKSNYNIDTKEFSIENVGLHVVVSKSGT